MTIKTLNFEPVAVTGFTAGKFFSAPVSGGSVLLYSGGAGENALGFVPGSILDAMEDAFVEANPGVPVERVELASGPALVPTEPPPAADNSAMRKGAEAVADAISKASPDALVSASFKKIVAEMPSKKSVLKELRARGLKPDGRKSRSELEAMLVQAMVNES